MDPVVHGGPDYSCGAARFSGAEGAPAFPDGEGVRIGEGDRLGVEVAHRLREREGDRVGVG